MPATSLGIIREQRRCMQQVVEAAQRRSLSVMKFFLQSFGGYFEEREREH